MSNVEQTIDISCSACGEKYRLARTSIGKSGKCVCGQVFVIKDASKQKQELSAALATLIKEAAETCIHHPDQPAVQSCAQCNSHLCKQCALRTTTGKYVCRGCVEKAKAKQQAVAAVTRSTPTPEIKPKPPALPQKPQQPKPRPLPQPIEEEQEIYEAEVIEDYDPLGSFPAQSARIPVTGNIFGSMDLGQRAAAPTYQNFQAAPFPTAAGHAQSAVFAGKCSQHPLSPVVHYCTVCHEPICRTCTFVFPPNITCCPKCATDTEIKLSTHRKVMIYGAVGCAAFATLSLTLLCSGLLGFLDGMPFGGLIAETAISLPLCLGMGLAIGSYNRTEGNPATLWVAGVWNALGLVALFLFMIIVAVGGFAAE